VEVLEAFEPESVEICHLIETQALRPLLGYD